MKPSRGRAIFRSLMARWTAFVYRDDIVPPHLKDEIANFFLALMTAFVVGSFIIRFLVRH